MKTRKRSLFAAAAIAATLVLSGCGGGSGGGSAEGGDAGTEFLTIATGGSSGVYYQVGAGLASVLETELGADTTVQATGASVENLNLLADGGAEVAFVMADAVDQALKGEGPFEGSKMESVPVVANLYVQYVQIITLEGSGINSVEDLKGKRVSVGDQGSGVELNAQMVLGAYDMSYDDFTVDYLSYADAVDQMKNGQLDALFATSGLPNSAVSDLATTKPVKVVPIDGAGKDRLISEYAYLGEAEVPAGTYGDSAAATTITIPNLLVVSPKLSDEAVYDITKAIFENLDAIQATHNAAKNITLEGASDVKVSELAPGAKKYYDEQ